MKTSDPAHFVLPALISRADVLAVRSMVSRLGWPGFILALRAVCRQNCIDTHGPVSNTWAYREANLRDMDLYDPQSKDSA